MSSNNNYLSTKKAAEELGVVVSTIYKYVKEGRLKPVYEDKWQIDETLLFRVEDIQRLKEKFDKPGNTTGEVAKKLGVHPTTVASYISKGILKATKQLYKGRELYFISDEEIENMQNSSVIRNKQQKKAFYTSDNYYLFQSLKNGDQIARIMELDGDEGKVIVEDGRTLALSESKEIGFEKLENIAEHKYITKRGYAKFIFPKPVHISSPVYTIVELLYMNLGYRNIKMEVVDENIHLEVKPIVLKVSKTTHETEILTMEKHLVEGKLYLREDKVYIDTELEPIMVHVPSDLKEQIKNNADAAKVTLEEYVLELIRKSVSSDKSQ